MYDPHRYRTTRIYSWRDPYETETVMALLDTGATHTLIPLQMAQRLGMPSLGYMDVETATDTIPMERALARMSVDGSEDFDIPVLVTPQTGLVAVGWDVIRKLRLLEPPPRLY